MEKQIDESTGLIVGSIEKQAARECERLEQSAESLYAEKVAALEAEIKNKYENQVSYELEKQRIDANKTATVLEADHKAALSALRRKVTDEVFAAAADGIQKFAASEDYASFLAQSAASAKNLYKGNAVIYLRACDEIYKQALEKAFDRPVSFETDDSIVLGGIKVRSAAEQNNREAVERLAHLKTETDFELPAEEELFRPVKSAKMKPMLASTLSKIHIRHFTFRVVATQYLHSRIIKRNGYIT